MRRQGIPENLQKVWQEEISLRTWAEERILSEAYLSEHLDLIEKYMNCVDMVRQLDNRTARRNALTSIFLRTFDNFCAAIREASSGNYRNCAMFLRDQLETYYLLDFLTSEHERPEHWMAATEQEMFKKYSPKKIREALDKRDVKEDPSKQGKSRRGEWYHMLSTLGAHVGPRGFELNRDGTRALRSGPFKQADSLRQCIEEAAKIALLLIPKVILYCYEFGDPGLLASSSLAIRFQRECERHFPHN